MSLQRRDFLQSLFLSVGSLSLLEAYDQINTNLDGEISRKAYSLTRGIHYLNHASIGTCPKDIQSAFKAYIEKCEENPARYIWGEEWDVARTKVRNALADLLYCEGTEMAITHNTTEGFNQIAQGLDLGPDDEVVFSNLNHAGASICFQHYGKLKGFSVRVIDIPLDEAIHWTADECIEFHISRLTDKTKLLVLPHIDNMIGYRHPVKEIAEKARQKGVEFIAVDAAQSIGMIPVNLKDLNIDFYCGSPHKWLQSPKGLGLFYVRDEVQQKCEPMWVTWGQKRWKDTAQIYEDYGTRDLPKVLALGHALKYHQNVSWDSRISHYQELRSHCKSLCNNKVSWYAPKDWSNGSSLFSIKIPKDGKPVEKALAKEGLIVRGFNPGFIRISPNMMNSVSQIDMVMESINKLV